MDSEAIELLAWDVPTGPGAATTARHLVDATVAERFPQEPSLREDVSLVTSELVTNAVRSARGQVTIRVSADGDAVIVSVTDDGPGEPRVRHPDPDDPTGRGLLLVEAVARQWGILRDGGAGKTVWAVCTGSAR